jgi:hypothetical protein
MRCNSLIGDTGSSFLGLAEAALRALAPGDNLAQPEQELGATSNVLET